MSRSTAHGWRACCSGPKCEKWLQTEWLWNGEQWLNLCNRKETKSGCRWKNHLELESGRRRRMPCYTATPDPHCPPCSGKTRGWQLEKVVTFIWHGVHAWPTDPLAFKWKCRVVGIWNRFLELPSSPVNKGRFKMTYKHLNYRRIYAESWHINIC